MPQKTMKMSVIGQHPAPRSSAGENPKEFGGDGIDGEPVGKQLDNHLSISN